MTTLITGGAGLLGAEIVHLLLERQEKDIIVVDLVSIPERLSNVTDRIEYLRIDLGNTDAVLKVVHKVRPRTIYHLGAMLGGACDEAYSQALRVNALGTFYILEAARRFGVSQVLFASSVATYGMDLQEKILTDISLQRPVSFYGVTKLFGEGVGLFFKRRFGIDFRGIRYPSIVGPGVNLRVGGVVSYTSAIIEESAKGAPYTVMVDPDTRIPIVYVRDAARAIVELAKAPAEKIKTVNYLIDGIKPTPTASELAGMVKRKIPEARIDFQPDQKWAPILKMLSLPIDDSRAREEWGWLPEYDYDRMIQDMLRFCGSHEC